ncbi:MAG: hypothetical protein GEU80_07440 [Dehalococcoidia bacterium]|nr:hypothetical protein [Dehalococcoidia bacterium]
MAVRTLSDGELEEAVGKVDYIRNGHIATVTIDNPASRNALSDGMLHELAAAYQNFQDDPEARVAIVRGAGDRDFSVGRDMKERARRFGTGEPLPSHPRYPDVTKPMIAAVQGYALGLGFLESLRCDVRIASETAKFGLTEVKVGMAGPVEPVIRVLPFGPALYMLISGAHVGAEQALRFGLVMEVVPQADLFDKAQEIAEVVAENAPLAVQVTKQNAYTARFLPPELASRFVRENGAKVSDSDDIREGARAFAEKRKPIWKGS